MSNDAYVYEKNRRFEVPKGSRAAFSEMVLSYDAVAADERFARRTAERTVMDLAVRRWEEEWGPLPWHLAQFLVTHVTAQVVCELRVLP